MRAGFPFVSAGLKTRLWVIIVIVLAYFVYTSLGDLIPRYWDWVPFKGLTRAILTLGLIIILLISLSGLALTERLTVLAIKDGLTGLYNQTYIKERLREEVHRAKRYVYPVSLLMIDLDDFKEVNDRYGHIVGDKLLQSFARVLLESIRASDIASRYGGEEFLVILPETGLGDASIAAERLRGIIGSAQFHVARHGLQIFSLTCSIGVYTAQQPDQSIEEMIAFTDAAVYQAKKEGKNVVRVFDR
jgi:diguanylate cyclase (GGDEF)-like protein